MESCVGNTAEVGIEVGCPRSATWDQRHQRHCCLKVRTDCSVKGLKKRKIDKVSFACRTTRGFELEAAPEGLWSNLLLQELEVRSDVLCKSAQSMPIMES